MFQLSSKMSYKLVFLFTSSTLAFLLERVGELFPSLLADHKDLDVDNNLVPYPAYLPQPESS